MLIDEGLLNMLTKHRLIIHHSLYYSIIFLVEYISYDVVKLLNQVINLGMVSSCIDFLQLQKLENFRL